MYFKDGDNLLIVASKGGHPKHPEWYLNLVANPDVVVQMGRKKSAMRAVTATEDEKIEGLGTNCERTQGLRRV
jgi:deazaflavin-dependent oxidoreductase (nitroreductase family)